MDVIHSEARRLVEFSVEERDQIHQYVMVSFSNFSNGNLAFRVRSGVLKPDTCLPCAPNHDALELSGMAILKQVLTQLLLYYTRLQKEQSWGLTRAAFSKCLG